VTRKAFGPKKDKVSDQFGILLAGHVASLGETKSSYRILGAKPLENAHEGEKERDGKMALGWVVGGLAQDRVQWLSYLVRTH
jgi:hypothetical protein